VFETNASTDSAIWAFYGDWVTKLSKDFGFAKADTPFTKKLGINLQASFKPMKYFITAIGTDSGKTLVSAILVKALQADYWKPIQAGLPRDTDTVATLAQSSRSVYHHEAYLLKAPMSPHAAAAQEGIEINLQHVTIPPTTRPLIIEGAGGVLVPLNKQQFVIDLAIHLQVPVILVANLYLGSINHTLLTVQELKRRAIPVKGIIFNGPANKDSMDIILHHSGYPYLLHIEQHPDISPETVAYYAQQLEQSLRALD
jgi:dethiobiotin synthetase